ncbi:oxidoreductase, partial [Mesorhizobium sp. M8A.F.Ca.ET.023.01.1.1]
MRKKIAIIGDNFMLPEVFRAKIEKVASGDLDIRTLQTAWPDEPMEFGNPALGLDRVKEYFGHPDEVVDFIGDAEILVTQLAPLSESMMRR